MVIEYAILKLMSKKLFFEKSKLSLPTLTSPTPVFLQGGTLHSTSTQFKTKFLKNDSAKVQKYGYE